MIVEQKSYSISQQTLVPYSTQKYLSNDIYHPMEIGTFMKIFTLFPIFLGSSGPHEIFFLGKNS